MDGTQRAPMPVRALYVVAVRQRLGLLVFSLHAGPDRDLRAVRFTTELTQTSADDD